MTRKAADPVRSFLLAVLARTETDAATLGAQDSAAEYVDRLDTADQTSKLGRLASMLGVRARRGPSTTLGLTETRRNATLATLTDRVRASEATPTEVRVGLRVAGRAVRAERQPVDETAVRVALGLLLSGAEGGPDAIPEHLRVGQPDAVYTPFDHEANDHE